MSLLPVRPSSRRRRALSRVCLSGLLLLCLVAPAVALPVLQGGLDQPSDVALRDDGRRYVLDGVNGRVVVFTALGERDFSFGRPGSGPGELRLPMGIAIAGGRVYVADTGNGRIAVFDLRGGFVRQLSLEAGAAPVAVHVAGGRLYWSDRARHRVCALAPDTGRRFFCLGERGSGDGQFRFPLQIAHDDAGYLYVVDVLNARVQVIHPRGRRAYAVGRFGLAPGRLFRPNGLAFTDDGRLLVGDAYRGDISVFRDGAFLGLLGDESGRPLHFAVPVGLRVQGGGLLVVEAKANRVAEVDLARTRVLPQAAPKAPVERGCVRCHVAWAETGEALRAQAQTPAVASPAMCYSCHHGAVLDSRRRIGRGAQHPDAHHRRETPPPLPRRDPLPAEFPTRADGQLDCASCHTPHTGTAGETLYTGHRNPWLRVANRDGDLCRRCHRSRQSLVTDTPRGLNHPVGIRLAPPPPGVDKRGYANDPRLQKGLPAALAAGGASLDRQRRMLCQTCHQIHGGEGEALTVLPVKGAELCIACHPRQHARDEAEARRRGIHPAAFELDAAVEIGGRRLRRVDCLSCHSVHGGRPDTPLLREESRDGRLCAACHEGYTALAGSAHDLQRRVPETRNRLGQTPRRAGLCGSCHSLHRGEAGAPALHAWKRHPYRGDEAALPRDTLCLDCHRREGVAATAVVGHFSHPWRDLILRSDPAVMPLLDAKGKPAPFGRIACITCHEPHARSDAEGHRASPFARQGLLRTQRLRGSLCVDCHGREAPRKYLFFHRSDTRDRVDYLQ